MGKYKKKKGKSKKKASGEQGPPSRYVHEWVFCGLPPSPPSAVDDFMPPPANKNADRMVFEFHSHSKYSDGFLSPAAVVERAHRNGVKVLALTDHDTMGGVLEAVEAARKFGMRIIPGVEISAVYSPREEPGTGEPVHILAYYSSCGPSCYEELDSVLANIRDGRYVRAKNMLLKLNKLKMPLKWEHVAKIAGHGVAPGRVHVARAMVEAGHVENLKQAFSRYLYDDGPAYARGSEPFAEAVVQLICRTGGIAALAHPWALKSPVAVIRCLKAAGLQALEVYRSDGKVAGFSDLADMYELVKLGGSDFHGRGGHDESDLGSVSLPLVSVYQFLKIARPVWFNVTKDILRNFTEEPCNTNLEKITKFGKPNKLKGYSTISNGKDVVDLWLSSWLTKEEMEDIEFEAVKLKLSQFVISNRDLQMHE